MSRVTFPDPFRPVRVRRPSVPQAPDPQTAEAALPRLDLTGGMVGLRAAAEALGVDARELQALCRAGATFCRKADNNRWLIDLAGARAAL